MELAVERVVLDGPTDGCTDHDRQDHVGADRSEDGQHDRPGRGCDRSADQERDVDYPDGGPDPQHACEQHLGGAVGLGDLVDHTVADSLGTATDGLASSDRALLEPGPVAGDPRDRSHSCPIGVTLGRGFDMHHDHRTS